MKNYKVIQGVDPYDKLANIIRPLNEEIYGLYPLVVGYSRTQNDDRNTFYESTLPRDYIS
jgi:hypothetical protein